MANDKPPSTTSIENWDALQSLFLEKPSPSPPDSVDNWSALQSLFNLDNQRPVPFPPETCCPPPADPCCLWWKWYWTLKTSSTLDPACFNDWLDHFIYFLINDFHPTIFYPAPTHYHQLERTLAAAEQARYQAEAASRDSQAAHRTAQTHATTIQMLRTNLTDTLADTEIEIATARTQVTATQAKLQTAHSRANQTAREIETIKTATETARTRTQAAQQQAEKDQKQIALILQKLRRPGSPDSPPSLPFLATMFKFLNQHKLTLLLGALALIPSLILLKQLLDRPPESLTTIYVNPVTGQDGPNSGTANAPFRSLSQALQRAGAGSQIHLAMGDYPIDRSITLPANSRLVIQPSNEVQLNDIAGHWAEPFIRALVAQELVAGYDDGNIRPDATLTRAEYATLLTRVFGLPSVGTVKQFKDVRSDFWAYDAIQTTYSQGFLKGPTEDDFQPNDQVQRVEVIATLVNGLRLPLNQPAPTRYQDWNQVPDWAKRQMATAINQGLVVNDPNSQRLNPIRNATRAETMVMMYQALVQQGKASPIDSPYLVK